MLSHSSHINIFILFMLQALIWPSISYLHGNFQFYNLKELWWIDNSSQGYNIDALISFLKLCPALEQLFVTVSFFNGKKKKMELTYFVLFNLCYVFFFFFLQIDTKSYCLPSTATYSLKTVTRHSKLEHLKLVKLEGITN